MADPEKGNYAIDSTAKDGSGDGLHDVDVRRGSIVLDEAKDLYGDAKTAEREHRPQVKP